MAIRVDHLKYHPEAINALSTAQFALWGPLTGCNTVEEYQALLHLATECNDLPMTLVANEDGAILGSVNVVEGDLPTRPDISPWLAQLFVFENFRNRGVGAYLVDAAVNEARKLSKPTIYLYTSGTLPTYYEKLGWSRIEEIEYLGKLRVVMACDTNRLNNCTDA